MAKPVWIVQQVEPLSNYVLLLTYASGEQRLFDVEPLICEYKAYRPLRDMEFFNKVFVECSSVAWDDKIDISPEYVYENSVQVSDDVERRPFNKEKYFEHLNQDYQPGLYAE